jgi:hypothetical protein
MARQIYDWDRYWVPREGALAFDDEGFLLEPYKDPQWRKLQRTDIVEYREIDVKPCLVLLGEPGIGKTFALDGQRSVGNSLFLNLGTYGDEQRLIDDLFGNNQFRSWLDDGRELRLFLDSFDECLLRLDNVASLLADQIQRLKTISGLSFRIASRTAEWRTGLEESMRKVWGSENVGVYELAPPTRDQVRVALEAESISPPPFIQEVIDREVVSFAIKPLTLDLLVRIWKKRGGSLPPTQKEIYEQGSLQLCSESNPYRDTPQLRRHLTADQRLAIAGHIAAATLFCKRSAISINSRSTTALETDLTLSELTQGEVKFRQTLLPVNLENLRETFDTGLFTARGPDRLGWAHQTYAEFLASRYLEQQNVSTRQIVDLIQHPLDPEKKLVPQLHETAAWIASNRREMFQQILKSEPDVLLRSDVATADDNTKSQLVEAILGTVSEPTFRPDWWKLRSRYRKLKYPGLVKQLAAKLRTSSLADVAKMEVIEMIEACDLRDLFPALAELAVAPTKDANLRQIAADLITRSGDKKLKRRLKPLALGKRGADKNEELRGAGLSACWPDFLTTRELFASLEAPVDHSTSRYSLFIGNEKLVTQIPTKDLPIALKWVESQPENRLFSHFGDVIHKVMERAATALDDSEVRSAFVAALLSRLQKHDYGTGGEGQRLNELLDANCELRRECINVALKLFTDPSHDAFLVTWWAIHLVQPKDLNWLLDRLGSEKSTAEREKLSHLVSRIFYPETVASVELVVESAKQCPELQKILAFWLEPIDLNSETGKKLKAEWDQEQEWKRVAAEQQKEPPPLDPPPAQRIRGFLDRIDQGDFDAWWQISYWVEIEDNGRYSKKDYYIDIRELPGWEKAAEPDKKRMVSAAESYLRNHKSDSKVWFAKPNVLYRPMLAGLRALLLLAKEDRQRFDNLRIDVWTKWLPAIVHQQHYNETNEFRLLLTTAIEKIPEAATDEILKAVETENRKGETLWILYKLGDKFDAAVGIELLARLNKRPALTAKCAAQLLATCVKAAVPGALDQARRWIPSKPPKQTRRRELVLKAAHILLLKSAASDWRRIWDIIQTDVSFGKTLFESVAYEHLHVIPPLISEIQPREVGLLWQWMLQHYPLAEDPDRSRGGSVTPRWAMADMRDSVASSLADRGTPDACEELNRLISKFPQIPWLKRVLARGNDQMRRNTWVPVSPEELFQLASNRKNRLVQNADQLMDAVVDALAGIQGKLHAETPSAPFLWNNDRPKEEEAISDWVKIELETLLVSRGIILNREVQIHIKEKTDIHVDAISRENPTDEFGRSKVIIEVKGCWNPDQKTAMQEQLVNRYLAQNDCRHGIFLLGWFLCNTWSSKDSRRRQVKFANRSEAEKYFRSEAGRLSRPPIQLRSIVLDATIRAIRSSPRKLGTKSPGQQNRAKKKP